MSIKKVLQKTKSRLIRVGWKQGSRDFDANDGPNCILGAITNVAAYEQEEWAAQVMIKRALGYESGDDCSLIVWNDAPGRTFEEVITTLDKAIELAGKES